MLNLWLICGLLVRICSIFVKTAFNQNRYISTLSESLIFVQNGYKKPPTLKVTGSNPAGHTYSESK